jgi:hypothetical protein
MNGIRVTTLLLALGALAGCQTGARTAIVASTGTVLGIEASQSPVSSSPQATIGFKRAEFTYVPVTPIAPAEPKEVCGTTGEGAAMCINVPNVEYAAPNVLTELYYETVLSNRLYQRMAVGDIAVKQGGAALIFAKGPDGELDAAATDALKAALSLTSTSYGCDASCSTLSAYLESDAVAFDSEKQQALEQCMTDNGLQTGAGRITEFLNLGKFEALRNICIETLEIGEE